MTLQCISRNKVEIVNLLRTKKTIYYLRFDNDFTIDITDVPTRYEIVDLVNVRTLKVKYTVLDRLSFEIDCFPFYDDTSNLSIRRAVVKHILHQFINLIAEKRLLFGEINVFEDYSTHFFYYSSNFSFYCPLDPWNRQDLSHLFDNLYDVVNDYCDATINKYHLPLLDRGAITSTTLLHRNLKEITVFCSIVGDKLVPLQVKHRYDPLQLYIGHYCLDKGLWYILNDNLEWVLTTNPFRPIYSNLAINSYLTLFKKVLNKEVETASKQTISTSTDERLIAL